MKPGPKPLNLASQKFGSLTAMRPIGHRRACVLWECRCDCGVVVTETTSELRAQRVISCGDCGPKTSEVYRQYRRKRRLARALALASPAQADNAGGASNG